MYCDNSFQLENRKEKIPNPFTQTFSNKLGKTLWTFISKNLLSSYMNLANDLYSSKLNDKKFVPVSIAVI